MPDTKLVQYVPALDLAQRWPDWIVEEFDQSAYSFNEFIDADRKRCALDFEGDKDWAIAVLVAHLDLGHHLSQDGVGRFTPEQIELAVGLAHLRMDDPLWPEPGESANQMRRMT
jgi:hypothetical protein